MAIGPIFTRIAAITKQATQNAMRWFSGAVRHLLKKVERTRVQTKGPEGADLVDENDGQEEQIREAAEEELIKLVDSVQIGKMYLFKYDAKTKDKLPYWDEFPLAIIIGFWEGGFMGINLHYLPNGARLGMLNALGDLFIDDKYDDEEKLDISYDILRSYGTVFTALHTDCIKKYLFSHVRSRFGYVAPRNWGHVAAMPFERWHYRK